MYKCKKIIKHAKNNYLLDDSDYKSHDAVLADCIEIHQYGSIPSVRRACKMFNESPYQNQRRVQPNIPDEVQEDLKKKRQIKKISSIKLTIRQGPITLTFD